MEEIKIVFNFIKSLVWSLVFEGILAIFFGILIFIYPDLLGMLVGVLIIITGAASIVLAIKVNKYSKFQIKA